MLGGIVKQKIMSLKVTLVWSPAHLLVLEGLSKTLLIVEDLLYIVGFVIMCLYV